MDFKTKYLKYKTKYTNLKMLNAEALLVAPQGGAGGTLSDLTSSYETIMQSYSDRIITEMIPGNAPITDIITLINNIIPTDPMTSIIVRQIFVKYFSWAIPSVESILEIKKFANNEQILEVGAGNGLWARLLKNAGCNIFATDNFSTHNTDKAAIKRYIEVEFLSNSQAIQKYNEANVLFLCWPPTNSMSDESIKLFKGNKLIYIGEGNGGATGSDEFHSILWDDWKVVGNIIIPRWNIVNDQIYLYERIPETD
jgi:uncharacterized UPF0146 family protein